MSFENRFLRIFQIACLLVILICSVAIVAVLYTQKSQDNITLEVKKVNPSIVLPKAKLIPASSKNSLKADISNASPSLRSRRPVVVTL